MKVLKILGVVFALLGLVCKFFGLPGASLILVLGPFLFTLYSSIFLIRFLKSEKVRALRNILVSLLMIYALFRIQYWQSGPALFGFRFTFILSLAGLILYLIHFVREPIHWGVKQIIVLVFALGVIILDFIPTYQLHYGMSLTTTFHEKNRFVRFDLWDKYSWFLYNSRKFEEALEANRNAQQALLNGDYSITGKQDEEYRMLQEHGRLISERNWKSLSN